MPPATAAAVSADAAVKTLAQSLHNAPGAAACGSYQRISGAGPRGRQGERRLKSGATGSVLA